MSQWHPHSTVATVVERDGLFLIVEEMIEGRILYNQPAGLTLYWTVQNLLSIAQMKLTKPADETAPAAPVAAALAPKKKR